MNIANLSSTQLRKAADLKEQIASLENRLAQILGASSQSPAKAPQKKYKMSAAGRARIAAAARARWAKVKGIKQSNKPAKRKMSAAARAKIAAAAKARWAKAKAAGKKSL